MYNTVVFPLMVFGLKVTTLTRENRRKLRRYERVCLKIMLKYSRKGDCTIRSARELLKGKTITKRIKVMRISYWGHVQRRPQNHMLRLAERYTCQKRKIGRPCYTNDNNMSEAFSKYTLTRQEWLTLSKNKHDLKKSAEEIYTSTYNDSSTEDDLVLSGSSDIES